ncbi:flagellar filament capping protein FliD [Vibrio variabilis]|uniref:flagellar filament capping protein FliD n=1 Tax=Vibrio variabilis TaxID=990271 RepID=UPI000DD74113|nr:flagellar filament capping protein FliD [Vibrio variabilis]
MSSLDPITMATQLATYDVQSFQMRYQLQSKGYQTKIDALSAIETALKDFEKKLGEMSGSDDSVLKNSATLSQEGYLTASADSTAIAGTYQFFVKQLASAHQFAAGMPKDLSSDTAIPASGEMTLNLDGESFTLDLSTLDSDGDGTTTIQELTKAINSDENNPGINASLVRSNGETHFVLSSSKTGEANEVSVSTNNIPAGSEWFGQAFDPANTTLLSSAKDAIIEMGGEGGLEVRSATNTFENMIDGLSVTATKVHQSGETGTTLTVGVDKAATKEEVNNFISAYNALIDTIDKYTSSGGEDQQRGVLAGDATVRSIESQISNVLREDFDGIRLTDLGITTSRDGKLELDDDKFTAFYEANPDKLNQLFSGDDQMISRLESTVEPYLKSSNGVFSNRKDSLEGSIERNDLKLEALERKYQMAYDRYLKQFTQMNTIMNQMNSTMGLFGSWQGEN